MIASDIDGTLLDYGYLPGREPTVNHALIAQLATRTNQLALVTNQGGLVFGWQQRARTDGRKYPTPADFALRLHCLTRVLFAAGILVTSVQVSMFHFKADPELLDAVRDVLWAKVDNHAAPVMAHTHARWRKPSPAMLLAIGATVYYGDSDEDEQAARAAACEFVRVPRFGAKEE